MLAAKQGVLLYPASFRENNSQIGDTNENHTAYALHDARKTPVKLSTQRRARSAADQNSTVPYDETIVFVNVQGLINGAIDAMRGGGPSERHARGRLLHALGNNTPTIMDVGRLLCDELDGHKLTDDQYLLLARIGQKLETLLVERGATKVTEQDKSWEVLPRHIIEFQHSAETDDPAWLQTARGARELYLQFGNTRPHRNELELLIEAMRRVKNPYIMGYCLNAYIDLARSPEVNSIEAAGLMRAALEYSEAFADSDWRMLRPEDAHCLFQAKLQLAYADKYIKTLSGQTLNMEDEQDLYDDLLRLGEKTIVPATELGLRCRALQLEIGIHLLIARRNLKYGKTLFSAWPSLSREANPHDSGIYLNGWDIAVTDATFLDQGIGCRFIRVDSFHRDRLFNPDITVVRGLDDLHLARSADIIHAAYDEFCAPSQAERNAATLKLDNYEHLFLQRLRAQRRV